MWQHKHILGGVFLYKQNDGTRLLESSPYISMLISIGNVLERKQEAQAQERKEIEVIVTVILINKLVIMLIQGMV